MTMVKVSEDGLDQRKYLVKLEINLIVSRERTQEMFQRDLSLKHKYMSFWGIC